MHAHANRGAACSFGDAAACFTTFVRSVPCVESMSTDFVARRFQPQQQLPLFSDVVSRSPSLAVGPGNLVPGSIPERDEEKGRLQAAFQFQKSVKILKPEILGDAQQDCRQ